MRLAVLFFAVFLASGAVLLAVTVAVWQSRTGNVAATAVPAPAGRNPATGITQHGSDRHQLLIASAIALAIMAGVSLAVGWLVAGRFLRPLRTITATTREISASNLHERLNLAGPDDELKELADTFDQLLDRLERSFAFERQFVANASHELRTPLAGDADLARRGDGQTRAGARTFPARSPSGCAASSTRSTGCWRASSRSPRASRDRSADQSTVSLAELARAGDRAACRRDHGNGTGRRATPSSRTRGSPAARRCSPAWSRT